MNLDNTILVALIAALSAIVGSSVSSITSYLIAVHKSKDVKQKKLLVQAYKDIAAYHRLEEMYTISLVTKGIISPDAIKRQYRKKLRDAGFESPSEDSTVLIAEKRIKEFS